MDQPTPLVVPRIGTPWPAQGGIYAGTVRGEDGQPDHHLILAETAPEERMAWQAGMGWAAALALDGFTDYALPTRREQSILYANIGEHFDEAWYWSSTQYAGHLILAWSQHFGSGSQYSFSKDYEGRCRAVRRFLII